ncbi:MAG: arginine--tRNA ligase [Methanobacteriota archaeon]|nr:MAG: arginine--tRNA ligase [Euryarchaeota archaeon]
MPANGDLDPLEAFRNQVKEALEAALEAIGIDEEPVVLEKPPQGMGDLAFPCFQLARRLRRNPVDIAEAVASKIAAQGMIDSVKAKGGYVNLNVNSESLARAAISQALSAKDRFGAGSAKGVRVLLEHTSVNPTGPIHIGRARNPIIGDTLARIMRKAGYDVVTEFYVNDVGRQVATMTWGAKNLTINEKPERDKGDHRYVPFYREAHRRCDEEPEVLEEVDALLYKLEHGDSEAVGMNRRISETVLEGMMESLHQINIRIDGFTWESRLVEDGSVDKVISKLKLSDFCRESEGAHHLELESFGITGRDTRWVFTRSDGTSLYTTRDLAYHLDKFTRSDVAINVLGEDQKLGMQQLAAALEIIGSDRKPETVFYAFVSLPEGRMSTRKGTVVSLDDLIDEAIERAYEEVRKRRTDLTEKRMKEIARIVGLGALRYNIARIQAEKQIVFKWEEALNFEGSSAPFLQYAHARACSILRKSGSRLREDSAEICSRKLVNHHERELIKLVAALPSVVGECADTRRVHALAAYGQDLAGQFNQFYRYVPVLKAEGDTRDARLALVEASKWALRNTLDCLGLEAPEEM